MLLAKAGFGGFSFVGTGELLEMVSVFAEMSPRQLPFPEGAGAEAGWRVKAGLRGA